MLFTSGYRAISETRVYGMSPKTQQLGIQKRGEIVNASTWERCHGPKFCQKAK